MLLNEEVLSTQSAYKKLLQETINYLGPDEYCNQTTTSLMPHAILTFPQKINTREIYLHVRI